MKIIIPWFKFLIELHETTGKAFAFPGVFILIGLATLPAWTQSADFINDPQSNDAKIGDVFSVTIQVAPTGTEVSVAEVHLNFDPSLLQVVSLTPAGSPLGNTAVSATFDNTMGTIEYGAFTLSNYPNTTFDFLTIEFEAVGLTPGTQVTHELAGFPVSLIAFEDVDLLDVANPIDVTITEPNQGVVCQEVLFRVNNGGVQTAAGDASSPNWGEDTQANPSPFVTLGSNNTFTTGTAIDMTHPSLAGTGITQAILQTERWANTTPPVMQWDFPVTAGSEIQIKLFLAELFVNGPGERVFDAAIEGVVPPAFDNLDPIALAGAKFKGVMVSHSLTVNDDNLDMDFIHVVQNPAIKAIEVCLVSEPPPPCDFVTTVDPTDPVVCEGNGSVDIQVTGGTGNEVITVLDANENPQNDLGNLPPGDYTYTVVDDGCEESGEFTINPYVDTQAPQISGCPTNIEVPAETGTCSAEATWTPPTATDDCPDPLLTSDFQPGDNFPAGATILTYTASDAAGNSSLCTFTVTVVDEEPPSITCPGDQTGILDANCEFFLPDYIVNAVVEDNCDDDVSVTQSPPASTPVMGNTTVTLTATDDAGNSSSCSFDVTVSDETAPSITCPDDQNETLDENNEFILPDYTVDATVSDNCDDEVSVTQNPLAGTTITENTTVTLTATDDAGNSSSCTFEVILSDEITLSITCPGDQNETLDENCEFVLPDYTTHVDVDVVYNGEDDLTLAQNPTAGSIITENTTITLTVTDESGNSSSCSFEVTVSDVTAPSITCPGEQMVDIDENCEFTVPDYTVDATASDNCDEDVAVTQSPLAGSTAVGNTTVTLTATDDAGNTNSCTIEVTVIDEIPPTITCPDDIDVGNDPGLCGAEVFWDVPEYSDNCPGAELSGTNESGDFFAVGKSTVFLTVTDAAGNTTECSFNITVIDIEAPEFENCPAPITVAAGSPVCEAEASWTPPTATDNCPNPSVLSSHVPGDVFSFGITTVTYTAVDAAENSAVCSFTVTVEDQTPPAITCPGDQNETFDENDEFTLPDYTGLADVSDNCDESVEVTQDPAAGTIVTGNTTVTLTATDDADNSSSCTFEVILSDELILSITCPDDQGEELDEDCELVLPDYTSLATVSYNGDENLSVTQSPSAGSVITGNTTVTLTVMDESGNSSSCSFEVTVSDGTAPSITCPDDQTADVDVDCEFILPDYTVNAVVEDNCDEDVSVTQSPLAGMTVTGNTTVTLTATDDAGNSSACSFEVTVSDETAPSITCPGDQSGTLNANCEFILPDYTVDAVVEDNCDEDVSVTQSPPAGTPVTGNTTVTLTATDDAGNSSSCTFEVTVSDEIPPSITCPADQQEEVDADCEFNLPSYVNLATTIDNCGAGVSVTQMPLSGAIVTGNTTMTLTATDGAGNSSSCTFEVIVSDETSPSITCPGDQKVDVDANCEFSLLNYTADATVSDNCDEDVAVTQSPPAGTTVMGNTIVTLTATDDAGNSSNCTFEVIVSDGTPPSINCPGDQAEIVNADCELVLPDYTGLALADDNCDSDVSISQSPLAGATVSGATTVTLTATDDAGNSSSCTFEVTVSDQTPPSIACPANQVEEVDEDCELILANYTGLASVSDNCDENVSVTQSPAAGLTVIGNTMVTLTATDDSGNSSSCSFLVVVADMTPPSITCPANQTMPLDENCEFILPNYTGVVTVSDNCDPEVTVAQDPAAGTAINESKMVTLTATDAAGNSATCTFLITVLDATAPFIACPNDLEVNNAPGQCGANAVWALPLAEDNCSGVTLSSSANPGDFFEVGSAIVTYSATDDSGNSASCSFTVTVIDTEPPVLASCPSIIITTNDPGQCGAIPTWQFPTATDNCSSVFVSGTAAPGEFFPVGFTTVVLSAADANGNTALCSFGVAVLDGEAPQIECEDFTLFIVSDSTALSADDVLSELSDNCEIAGVSLSQTFFTCDDIGTEIVTVTAVDINGNPASCTATITVDVSEGLPDDWENEDVGSSDPPGFAEFAPCDGEFTVGSTGFNGQLTQDALHIAYQELCGDGVITARVVDISSPTDIPGFAGVIMRKDSTIGSPFASLLTRLSTFVYRRVRTTQDAAMVNQQLFRPQATWLRLERSGNSITGYTSINGDNWSFAFAANVNLGECILVGLTAESYTQNVPITATFSDVSITGFNPIPLVAPPAGPPAGNQTIGISLYPNPVDEGLNVMIENASEGEVELEIIDLNGRQLYRRIVDEELPRIEMNLQPLGLPDGVYILRIRVDDQFFVERFIKRKVN